MPTPDLAGLLALAIRLHAEGVLSEGQIAKASGLDRVEIRRLREGHEEAATLANHPEPADTRGRTERTDHVD